MNEFFISALPIIQSIEKAGFEAYFVGGSVRDFILGRDIHDVDIATSATPSELKHIFPRTVDVGIEHGTIMVLYNDLSFEVTTYRTESEYKDYRRPESVTFIRSLYEDLQRRDFTMNAIAMDGNGVIVDPFHGREALKNHIIETVGEADNRFREDALRLMRAIRFVSQLDFDLNVDTEAALSKHAYLLEYIAVERISAEMQKLLDGKYKRKALQIALKTKLHHYLPSLCNQDRILNEVLSLPIEPLNETDMWLLFLYIAEFDQPIELMKKWKFPAKKIHFLNRALTVLQTRTHQDWSAYNLYCAGEDIAITVEKLHKIMNGKSCADVEEKIETLFKKLPIISRDNIVISGNDILAWTGKTGGPWMKELFIRLEKAILTKEIVNDKEEIRRWINTCLLL